jgi:hypothetical protein
MPFGSFRLLEQAHKADRFVVVVVDVVTCVVLTGPDVVVLEVAGDGDGVGPGAGPGAGPGDGLGSLPHPDNQNGPDTATTEVKTARIAK